MIRITQPKLSIKERCAVQNISRTTEWRRRKADKKKRSKVLHS